MTDPKPDIAVTQADRDAAAPHGMGFGYIGDRSYSAYYMIRNGHWDGRELVQAFARHRHRSQHQPDDAAVEREKIVAWLREAAGKEWYEGGDPALLDRLAEEIARGDHLKPG